MKKLIIPLLGLCLAPVAALAEIRINEVHYNVPGPDLDYEFIELKSTTNGVESCAGLTLVIICNALSDDDEVTNPGEIMEVLDLGDLSTGTNGLLLLGNGYTQIPVGGPWAGAIDPETAMGDPPGLGNSDIKPNTGFTVLLVRNYNAVAGVKGADVDKDVLTNARPLNTGNGVLDWEQSSPPAGALPALWAPGDLIDSIGIRDVVDTGDALDAQPFPGNRLPYTTTAANLTATWGNGSNRMLDRDYDTFARQLGNDTPNNALSYYGAQLLKDSTNPTEVVYRSAAGDNRTFGPGNMVGQVTPGRANLATGIQTPVFKINEVGLNPSGAVNSDDRFQYVEIINTEGAARSLNGYWLILLDSFDGSATTNDNSPGVGGILEEWNLSTFATGTNGLLLLGDGFSSTFTPFQDTVDPKTTCGDPTGFGSRDLRFKDGHTLLLVRGYSPSSVRDLDSSPEDGILDPSNPPWTLIDSIGFTQVGKTTIGKTYASVDLRTVMNPLTVPDNFSRKPGDISSTAAAWYGGRFPGGSSPMNVGFEDSPKANASDTFTLTWFGGFRGAGTPGRANLSAPVNPTAPPIATSVRINEVMIDPTNDLTSNTDASNEYIEIISTNEAQAYLDGLSVLVVDTTNGNIITGFPLDGYTTGLNGLALMGDGYDNTNGFYVATEGTLPPVTMAFDPPVGMEANEIPDNGCAVLLVRGLKGPITLNANGKPVGDLDPENDGVLLAPTEYTDELLDSVATGAVNPGPAYGWIQSAFLPHHIARYPGNLTASSAASWYYGQIPQEASAFPLTYYTGSYVGTFQGAASPGRANHGGAAGPTGAGEVVFNELHLNPAGADNNFEYLEIISKNGGARSLNGYSVLAIDNETSNTGTIRSAWSLDGLATGSNGLLLLGNNYPKAGQNPWQSVQRAQTGTGDPVGRDGLASSFGNGILGGETDNVNITLLLVRNFNGFVGQDLDETSPVMPSPPTSQDPVTKLWDVPGDGIFDQFPWLGGATGILDSIMLRSYAPTIPPPATIVQPYPYDGWTYSLADITGAFFPNPATLFYHVESIARFRGELAPNSATAWYGGDLTGGTGGNSGTAEDYITATQDPTHPPRPDGFWGRVTPGQPNLVRSMTGDTDGDGLPDLVEAAINSNPASGVTSGPLPMAATVTQEGQTYMTFSYPRILTGVTPQPVPYAAEAYVYTLETSSDLATWAPAPASGTGALVPVGTAPNPDGVTETATVRLPDPVTTAPGRQFVRLRVTRR